MTIYAVDVYSFLFADDQVMPAQDEQDVEYKLRTIKIGV